MEEDDEVPSSECEYAAEYLAADASAGDEIPWFSDDRWDEAWPEEARDTDLGGR